MVDHFTKLRRLLKDVLTFNLSSRGRPKSAVSYRLRRSGCDIYTSSDFRIMPKNSGTSVCRGTPEETFQSLYVPCAESWLFSFFFFFSFFRNSDPYLSDFEDLHDAVFPWLGVSNYARALGHNLSTSLRYALPTGLGSMTRVTYVGICG